MQALNLKPNLLEIYYKQWNYNKTYVLQMATKAPRKLNIY